MVSSAHSESRQMFEQWHNDQSYSKFPAQVTIMVARELPSQGCDLLVSSACAAFEALSDGLKQVTIRECILIATLSLQRCDTLMQVFVLATGRML